MISESLQSGLSFIMERETPMNCFIGGYQVEKEIVIVLDFGGQYNQLIARRIRECNVYCEVLPYTTSLERIREIAPKGIIFTGGPASVYEPGAPSCDPGIFSLGIPILGICYGCQLDDISLSRYRIKGTAS